MASKLFISDERMLALMQYAVEKGIVENETEYMDKIKFLRTGIIHVRAARRGFTKEQILHAAKLTGANINWIYGLENNMMRKPGKKAIELLKEAVTAIDAELKNRASR